MEELLRLPWFAAALAKLKHRRAGGEPSYGEKLKWLVEYGKVPDKLEKVEKTFNEGTYTFHIGTFWNTLLRSAPKPETLLIIGPHKWITDAVAARRALRAKKATGLGRVPIDVQVGWLRGKGYKPHLAIPPPPPSLPLYSPSTCVALRQRRCKRRPRPQQASLNRF